MDKATYQDLSERLETNNYFRLDEFPDEKKPVVSAYLYGALHAGEVLSVQYQNKRYSIKETQGGLIDGNQGRQIDFQNLSDMLHDGAEVRIKE
ncbi:hypothetical protein [Halorientalis pallida]|uniref:Uncharacterized protein n=1 Tax=Halorientalis pallida TaxID=2479928 RepID=A0A498L8L3_9EURY|nr:hypothetical protein [Halorientalis pallida]RXK51533.1 hypothetical protein EAF64_02560 [Halorientalis pallida]